MNHNKKINNIQCNDFKKITGFTLVESLVAISILLVSVLSGFILVTRILAQVNVIQDRLTASHLAQEGIELVRQIRDTNFIQQRLWNNGLVLGEHLVSAAQPLQLLPISNNPFLTYNNSTGIFGYGAGEITNFRRRIIITQISGQQIRVQSIVSWQIRGRQSSVTVETNLFNWLGN